MKTLVIHNSGILNSGPTNMTGASVGKEVLQTLHTPVIYIEGGPTDIAYENGMDDFKRISHVPAAIANLPVGHGGTFNEPNGGAAASVAVSWLNWQLRGDAQSAKRFVGEDCGLCKDAQWSLQRKQFAEAGGAGDGSVAGFSGRQWPRKPGSTNRLSRASQASKMAIDDDVGEFGYPDANAWPPS